MKNWGFTRYERRALLLFIALVLIGSSIRYYQHRSVNSRLEIWNQRSAQIDSLTHSKIEVTSASPIDINAADARQLQRLPGIGPVLAGRIIDWRNQNGRFSSVSDLDKVFGIGPALLERLNELVTVAPADTTNK